MIRTNMFAILTGVAVALMSASAAKADLTGSTMNLTVTHDQFTALSAITNVVHTYGGNDSYSAFGWGNLAVSSPALAVGMDNALNVNFASFAYSAFVAPFPATGTIKITNLAEAFDLSSVKVLVNGIDIATAVATSGNGFQASWSAVLAFNGNPVQPNVTLAWNSIPAPGAASLLALAGLIAHPRRRRS